MIGVRTKADEFSLLSRNNWFIRLFAVGFAAGIIIMNTVAQDYITKMGIFGDYFLMKYQTAEIDSRMLFGYIFEKRLLFFMALFFFGMSGFGRICCRITAILFGFGVGAMLSAAAGVQGLKGILICIASWFPQMLLYVPQLYFTLQKIYDMSENLLGMSYSMKSGKRNGGAFAMYALFFLVMAAVLMIGILLESYVNPVIIKKLIAGI